MDMFDITENVMEGSYIQKQKVTSGNGNISSLEPILPHCRNGDIMEAEMLWCCSFGVIGFISFLTRIIHVICQYKVNNSSQI